MADEVKVALFSMDPYKAPRPDGFQAMLYRKSWGVVGCDLSNFVLSFLHKGPLLDGVCDIFISLLPKVPVPKTISQFCLKAHVTLVLS